MNKIIFAVFPKKSCLVNANITIPYNTTKNEANNKPTKISSVLTALCALNFLNTNVNTTPHRPITNAMIYNAIIAPSLAAAFQTLLMINVLSP